MSKERAQWYKEDIRKHILETALPIVNQDDWDTLSMIRIVAGKEYTKPVIYEYLKNEEDIS